MDKELAYYLMNDNAHRETGSETVVRGLPTVGVKVPRGPPLCHIEAIDL